tara:strand:+ start:443 stop:577 length:135 start_codon:yes stop_codon:yes gene_type:complete
MEDIQATYRRNTARQLLASMYRLTGYLILRFVGLTFLAVVAPSW